MRAFFLAGALAGAVTASCGPNDEYSNIVECALQECPRINILDCILCTGCLLPDPGGEPETCADLPANDGSVWDNGNSQGCAEFEANDWCELLGDDPHPQNLGTANEKCCFCGGGLTLGKSARDGRPNALGNLRVGKHYDVADLDKS
jgi:hypothetical protein